MIRSLLVSMAFVSMALINPAPLWSGLPIIESVSPAGGTRGGEVAMQIRGVGFADAQTVLTETPGIEVGAIEVTDDKVAKFTVKMDADVKPGLHPFWLVTETGMSNMRVISVSQSPSIAEVEPNNTADQAQAIEATMVVDGGVTIDGVVNREDVDCFAVQLDEGQRIAIEVEGLRLHYTLNNQRIFDPSVAVLDEDGFEVVANDDFPLRQQDGLCQFVAPQKGRYTIAVRDSAFGGHPTAVYRMHLGSFPRPIAVIPPVAAAGQSLSATVVEFDAARRTVDLTMPPADQSTAEVTVEVDGVVAPSPNHIGNTDLPIVEESEPNNSMASANEMSLPGVSWGIIDGGETEDEDFYAVDCKKGKKYVVAIHARGVLRSPLDAMVNVFGPDNKHIGGADDVAGAMDPFYEFTAAADGRHTIRVRDHLRGGSPLHLYYLDVRQASRSSELTLKELRRDEAYRTIVPRGGHGVAVVRVKRNNHNDAIEPVVDDLPPGVTAQTWPIPASRGEMPIVFSATNDAGLAAYPLRVGDKAAASSTRFEQNVKTVLGQNRRSLLSQTLDHSHLVVTQPDPFKLQVVAPKSPIVRGGSKDLIMRIERGEDFRGKPFVNGVYLRTTYNPPGLGINNGKRFEKDATEIRIPMTANGNAAIGKWPLVFIARYAVPGIGGAMEVATPPVMIDIEESWFGLAFAGRSTGEIGGDTSITVNVETKHDLPADAELQLMGLPKGVTSSKATQPIDRATKTVTFPLTITADAKPGLNKNLICMAKVNIEGDPVLQTLGGGQLRIDKPIVKKDAEPTKPAEKAKPNPKPSEKPMSRLEQLRAAAGNDATATSAGGK